LVALAKFMRLSLQKAAQTNLAGAAYRKSGSQQRTWDEEDGTQPLPTLCYEAKRLLKARILWTPAIKAFEKIVIGPCTLVRTWGTRPSWSVNEIRCLCKVNLDKPVLKSQACSKPGFGRIGILR
jgi:hypothetical protein